VSGLSWAEKLVLPQLASTLFTPDASSDSYNASCNRSSLPLVICAEGIGAVFGYS